MNKLGEAYSKTYDFFCGKHPNLRMWHFQWLSTKDLNNDLRRLLPEIKGRILDVGCGEKPYEQWLNSAELKEYIGIDIFPGPKVDRVITPGNSLPFKDDYFDAIICTQVLEHVPDIENVLNEIYRVLKPGGRLIVSMPFIYNAHGAPHDYRRFSLDGINLLFFEQYKIIESKKQGKIGTTLGVLCLNWLDTFMNQHKLTRLLKGVLLPIWLLSSFIINITALLLDKIDKSSTFYSNVLVVALKCE